MTTPMQPQEEQGPQSPIPFEMLMNLRNQARQKQGMQDAATRRLGSAPPVSPEQQNGGGLENESPDDMVLDDIQNQMEAAKEPPDIKMTAANTMMRYGAIQEYLARAKGEMPNG